MSIDDTADIAGILLGYESWRKARVMESESWEYDPLSVSAYLDELAKMRALEILGQIQEVYGNPELTWQEVDAEIRNLIGVQK